ncbi:MAG: multidrug ABC transporter permease [Micrococcales bacterium 70-64]|jgi:ABC-2 type transport system permease protein|nr:ABC transporter permease [Leifsonia sp.]ODU64707.1 MAG: multidrug ABC transporter permease [Leifsonia sp. SCN 70-46]OJX86398.1 MAG: multidrug ABC transporter permease [Micrococcales bacterium 70-64]
MTMATATWTVLTRELRPVLRDPFSLIFSLLQPLVFLGLFGPLLVSSSPAPAAETLQSFVPGILVMIALFGTGTTGSNLLYEMQTGSHERTLVAPIPRSSLLVGRALKEMVPIMVQACIIALVTIPFGFSVNPLGLLLGLVMLAVFGLGFGALSYSLALASRNNDWMFWGVQQATLFPLMILSGMLLPLENGPQWMQVAAAFNPISYVVAGERALLAGDLGSMAAVWGFVAAAVLAAIGLAVGIRAMKKAA